MAFSLTKLMGRSTPAPVVSGEVKTLVPYEPKRLITPEAKSIGLLPQGAYGPNYVFFSPDSGKTFFDTSEQGLTALAFTAYWYIASRWVATKVSEAPLIVVEQDDDTGMDSWIPDHDLAPVLEDPSPDYDMGEMVEITSHYLYNTGGCLWVFARNGFGEVARITPFSYNEFIPQRTPDRIYGAFEVQTANGPMMVTSDNCCFFRDTHGGTGFSMGGQGVSSWGRGRSRLDIAMSWLALGEKSQRTIRALLDNSISPSLVISPDKDWEPSKTTLDQYKQDIAKYGRDKNGQPFIALGGAQVTQLRSAIKDIVPSEILNRVEAVVAGVAGVPAIILQFEVGLQNAPWSHMTQARRMAYEDTIAPMWRKLERPITRQILRPIDEDTTHYIRFDKDGIDSLKRNQLESAQIATLMGNAASLNERRAVMGLEPSKDKKADEIPELVQPSMQDILAGMGKTPPGKPGDTKPPKAEGATVPSGGTSENGPADATKETPTQVLQRKFKGPALIHAFRMEAIPTWKLHAQTLLSHDADQCAGIVEALITDSIHKSIQSKARGHDRAMAGVNRYLEEDSKSRWATTFGPMYSKASERAGAVIAANMDISWTLIHSNLLKFARLSSAQMVTDITETTRKTINGLITDGLEAGNTATQIAQSIREDTGFTKVRSQLIARTETTKAFNGAPTDSLKEYGKTSGRVFTKTWSGVLDDRERDEHVDLEGETVAIDDVFSNGEDYPGEPNCRCTVIFNEEEA